MSVKLDPKEVLHYLNELGYCNISAQQLKEFMRGKKYLYLLHNLNVTKIWFIDLKKLMKYDIQKAEKENIPLNKKRLSPQKYETPCSQVDFECARNFKSRTQSPISQKQTTCKDVNYACAERPYVSEPVDVVFSNLHSASTVSSRARYVGQTPNIPGVSFARPRKSSSCGASEGSRLTSFYTECTDESLRPKNTLSNKRPKSAAPYLKRPKSCKGF